MTRAAGPGGGRFVSRIIVGADAPAEGYPFDLPVVRALRESGGLSWPAGVTFLVGENGSGKSTVIEAVAVALGLNPEGGSRSLRFTTRAASESALGSYLHVTRRPGRERSSFFLRAESLFNVATEIERLDGEPAPPSAGTISAAYGGPLHEQSHGESFISLLTHRLGPRGLYLLDEPESALSPTGCIAAAHLLSGLADRGCQVLVATHSPILLAVPGATIWQIDADGHIDTVDYDSTQIVALTRRFLADPDAFLRRLDDTE